MRSFVLALVLLGTASWSDAYSAYQRSSAMTSSSSSGGSCCSLSPWANEHMDAVRLMAERLRQYYNSRSRGGGYPRSSTQEWSESLVEATGKTEDEIDAVSRQLCDRIIADMKSGRVTYGIITQPNFFESQAAGALEKLVDDAEMIDQQQQVELYEPGAAPPIGTTDLSGFDNVQHVNYPTEVKVVGGQTFITNKNFTTATKHGTPDNPYITTVRVNRTTTHTSVPLYVTQGTSIGQPFINLKEHNIYNHLKEVGVANYSPEVTVDDSLVVGFNHARDIPPPILIPVDGGDQSELIKQYGIQPGHTVTIRKYNRTIITGPDGIPIVLGSSSKSIWDNGHLVFNYTIPFGKVNWTKEDLWKRDERERLFWLFSKGSVTIRELEEWQRNQEERLTSLALRSNKTLEEIEEWQRQELERFKILINQYNTMSSDLKEWQKTERGRIDWLIHQNGITREELDRWQRENLQRLNSLARQYRISIEELREYQRQELERLYIIFNKQNSQISSDNLKVFENEERNRLQQILLQHNATVDELQEQIRRDKDRYKQLADQYRLNVEDMERIFKEELNRLTAVINQQREEMKRITDWQRSERTRLEDIIRQHNFTVDELEQRMKLDRSYLQGLAQKYHISLEDLEKWQKSELARLHEAGRQNLQKELEVWQKQERDRMLAIIKKNDLTIEEYEAKIGSDRARLQQLATMYQVQVEEIEKWLREEAQRLKNQGAFDDVQKNLTLWQQQERNRLQAIVQNNELTIEELQKKIASDQSRLYALANTYQVRVEEIEEWLKKELLRLQSQGLVKVEDLEDWQKAEREKLLNLANQNRLTIEDFETKLLNDKNYLQQLANQYHVELKDIEEWLRKESTRLQTLGLIDHEKLAEWQKVERDRLLTLSQNNQLSIDNLENEIKANRAYFYQLARQYSVRVEEIEEWIRNEVLRIQNQAKVNADNLKEWQRIERERLQKLVNQHVFTTDDFAQKLRADHGYLQQLAMEYKVEFEDVENWVKAEGDRFESLGLIKPSAPLKEWQEVEREHVFDSVFEGENQLSLDQLEQRLKNDRAHLYSVAQEYKVQVQEIEEWIRKELLRLQNQGVVQLEELKKWQQTERDRLAVLVAQQQSGFSVDDIEKQLKADRQRLQTLANQNNLQVKEIEQWIHEELQRMKNQGQVQIDNLTEWQKGERDRLLLLAQQQSDLSAAELEKKLQADRSRLQQLAWQYHIEVEEVEQFIRNEVQRLRDQGKLQIEDLTKWQQAVRTSLQELIQQQNVYNVEELEALIKANRGKLQNLANQFHIQVDEVEEWFRKDLKRLQDQGSAHIVSLTDWQLRERQRLEQLLRQNRNLTVAELEQQLTSDKTRLQQLARQNRIQIEEYEQWIKRELARLKNEGKLQIERLTAWQEAEKERIFRLAEEQNNFTLAEIEQKLLADRNRIEALSREYHVSVEEIEKWLKSETLDLLKRGIIGELKDWQRRERMRIENLVRDQNLTVEQFEEQLRNDRTRLQNLAWHYQVDVEDVEEWISLEGARQIKPAPLTAWQQHEQQRLMTLLAVQDLTLDELEWKLKNDRPRLQQLAQMYHVTVEEIEQWILNEGKRLIKPESLTPWQKAERQRLLDQLQLSQSLTTEEFEDQLKANRYRLQQIAQQYRIPLEEVEQWFRKEGTRLIKPVELNEWQLKEHDNLVQLIAQNDLTIQQLKQILEGDRPRLQQLANQYHVTVEDIEEWIIKDGQKLIAPTYLTEWQRKEHENLLQQIRQNDLTLEQLKQQLQADRNRFQQLAQQYHVTIEDIQSWVLKEGQKLINPTYVNEWQRKEHDNLVQLVTQNDLTVEDLRKKLQADRPRLQQLAQQYHVTVEEIEEWVINEGQKLIRPAYLSDWQRKERENLLQQIRQNDLTIEDLKQKLEQDRNRLQQLAYQYQVNVQDIQNWIIKEGQKLLNPAPVTEWQRKEHDNLVQLITQNDLTIEDLRKKLQADRPRLQQLAQQYHVTVEEIEEWVINEGQRLIKPAYLSDWQIKERDTLLQQIRQNDLTIEQLKLNLETERARLQQLANQYQVSIQELQDWILKEGQKLLKPIEVKEWQRKEHNNLVQLITQNDLTIEDLRRKLQADKPRLQQLAQQYHVTVEEIEEWVINEGQRLIKPAYLSDWQIKERDTLLQQIRQNDLTIEQLKANLAAERTRLQQLAMQYQVSIRELQDWILKEGQKLLKPTEVNEWQRKEHDNLVQLITQNDLTIEDLRRKLQTDRPRLQQLAQQYHVTVEEIEEWVINEGQRLIKPAYLTDWQIKERDTLLQQIRQNDLTIQQLKRNLETDRARLQQLANQYQVTIQELQEWILKEGQKLLKPIEVNEWQRNERDNLVQLISQNDLTIQDLRQKIQADRPRLEQLANQYHVTVEEIEEWIINEGQKLVRPAYLSEWQLKERDNLLQQIRQNHLTIEELEKSLQADRDRLQQLALQYHLTIQELQGWLVKEGRKLLRPQQLNEWQRNEHDTLVKLITHNDLTIEDLRRKLASERARLQQLANQYHVTVEEIEEWIISDGQRLISPAYLTEWQRKERDHLLQQIRQDNVTLEELKQQILADRGRLQQIAAQYRVTIEEIEQWIINEGKKFIKPAALNQWQQSERDRLLLLIQQYQLSLDELRDNLKADRARLEQLANQSHVTVEEIEEWIINEGRKLVKSPGSDLNQWQQHEREYLLALAQANLVTLNNFEEHLQGDNLRMENVASHYRITVPQIVNFLRKEVQRLAKLKLISTGEEVGPALVQWQDGEQKYIQDLLALHTWSIEELERKLKNDEFRLRQLAEQFNISIEQVKDWYRSELQKLLRNKAVYSENLTEWQMREKERMYLTLINQRITLEELERQLGSDRRALRRLAQQYRITIQELIDWQRKELARMSNLGLGKSRGRSDWEALEKKRLRAIPEKVIITKEELSDFIKFDTQFEGNLTEEYGVSPQELKFFQVKELQSMKNDGLLEVITLKPVEDWQRRERDRLYSMIRTQSFSLRKLRDWQSRDRLNMIASLYRIPVETIRNWQFQEMQRIEDIAQHYKMSLNRLEDFRHGELERLAVAAHQAALTETELSNWSAREESRLNVLSSRTGLQGAKLDKWRRKLYLLAQGLIDLDFDEAGYGGIELNTSTSASGQGGEVISADRGDQPPQVYQEEFDEDEPSLGSHSDVNAPMVQMPNYDYKPPHGHGHGFGHGPGHRHGHGHHGGPPPFQGPPPFHGPPSRMHHGPPPPSYYPGERIQAERVHRKKEYTFTVPGEAPPAVPNYGRGSYGGVGAGVGVGAGLGVGFGLGLGAHSQLQNDQDNSEQQQVQVEDWNPSAQQSEKLEDLGQQHQTEDLSQFTAEDFGQQHQREDLATEDLGQQHQREDLAAEDLGQQQVQVEDLSGITSSGSASAVAPAGGQVTEKIVTAEADTEPPKSVWGKLKSSAKSWFG